MLRNPRDLFIKYENGREGEVYVIVIINKMTLEKNVKTTKSSSYQVLK